MLNKRKKILMDPKRISNYNKFLCTLDQTPNLNVSPNNTILNEKYENLKTELNIKNELDKIIDKINNNFKISDYSSCNFTGLNSKDSCCVNNIDPNYYRDFINRDNYILNYTRYNNEMAILFSFIRCFFFSLSLQIYLMCYFS